jgi:hypothetical protein
MASAGAGLQEHRLEKIAMSLRGRGSVNIARTRKVSGSGLMLQHCGGRALPRPVAVPAVAVAAGAAGLLIGRSKYPGGRSCA